MERKATASPSSSSAYVLNATISEAQGIALKLHRLPSPAHGSIIPRSCTHQPSLDLSHGEPEDLEWWKCITGPASFLSVAESQEYMSLDVANLGSLDLGVDRSIRETPSHGLPSESQAGEYLQKPSFSYDLGA